MKIKIQFSAEREVETQEEAMRFAHNILSSVSEETIDRVLDGLPPDTVATTESFGVNSWQMIWCSGKTSPCNFDVEITK